MHQNSQRNQRVRQRSATPLEMQLQTASMQQRQAAVTPQFTSPQFSPGTDMSPSPPWRQQQQQTARRFDSSEMNQTPMGGDRTIGWHSDSSHTPQQNYQERNSLFNKTSSPLALPPFSPTDARESGLDAERTEFLYTRFYGYARNPTGWQHKMDFWLTALDKLFQRDPSFILFTPRRIEQHFEYDGFQPKCMRRVLVELMRRKGYENKPDVGALQDYFADFSWFSWSLDMLFNKPFAAVFVLLKWGFSFVFSLITASAIGDSSDYKRDSVDAVSDPSIDDRDADAAEAARDLPDNIQFVHRPSLERFIVQFKRDIANRKVFSARKFQSPSIFSFDEYAHELIPYLESNGAGDARVAALILRHLCLHADAVVESPPRQLPYHQQILSALPAPSTPSSSKSLQSPVSTSEILIKLSPRLFPASAAALSSAPSLRDVKSSPSSSAVANALAITERDKVRRSLQLQIDKFEQQFDALEHERARLREQAKEFVKAQRKLAALRSLRKMKLLQVRSETLTKHIDNLEHMLGSIEDAEQNASLFEIVKLSKRALEKAQSDITIEQVEEIMDDINERIEMNEQIGDMLATGTTSTVTPTKTTGKLASDEDTELERELDELLRDDAGADELTERIEKLKVVDTSIRSDDDDKEDTKADDADKLVGEKNEGKPIILKNKEKAAELAT